MKKILLLEDDLILQEIIEEYLVENGYTVDSFFNGEEALDKILSSSYDMLLLDVNVPEINGFEIVEYIKKELKKTTPVIFITSLTEAKNLEKAFDIGANDYLKKPFDLDELKIRIEHHLSKFVKSDSVEIGDIIFSPKKQILIVDGKEVKLKSKESLILQFLLEQNGDIVSVDDIIFNIWGENDIPTYATIRTYIKNLRKALGSDIIENVKGDGYRIKQLWKALFI